MQHAQRLPALPPTRNLVAPVVALLVGAAAATGAYALIDDGALESIQPARVIVVDAPSPPSLGVSVKDEAGTAAAVGERAAPASARSLGADSAASAGQGTATKNEAGTAAAIDRETGTGLSPDAKESRRTDPHGPAAVTP